MQAENPITLEDVRDAWEFYLRENLEEDWFQERFVERLKDAYPELDHEDVVAASIEHTAKLKVEVKLMDENEFAEGEWGDAVRLYGGYGNGRGRSSGTR